MLDLIDQFIPRADIAEGPATAVAAPADLVFAMARSFWPSDSAAAPRRAPSPPSGPTTGSRPGWPAQADRRAPPCALIVDDDEGDGDRHRRQDRLLRARGHRFPRAREGQGPVARTLAWQSDRGLKRTPWERPKTISPKKRCFQGPIKSLISKW
jgi:hypothetical protein